MNLSKRGRARFIEGAGIYLSPMVPDDAEGGYPEWFNDRDVCRGNGHHVFPYTQVEARKYIEGLAGHRTLLVLAIVANEGDIHIGNISLQNICFINRSAELAILIGEKDFWRQGFGLEASRLMLAHAFESLNMHRVCLGTLDNNMGMQRIACSCGMEFEGRRKEAVFKDGAYRDVMEYGITAAMYYASKP